MKNMHIIERYGGIIEEEPLSCIENDLIMNNTCVLEAVAPYFGYYNEVKSTTKPYIVYFILDGYFSLEALSRATVALQKKVSFHLNAVTGTINLLNQTCNVIQILNISNYSHISLIQQLYIDEGLVFKKKSNDFQNEMALIKLRNFFNLIPLENGLFIEKKQPNIGYFTIPKNIDWEAFKKLTIEVKYEADLLYFDAARAYMYEGCGITDLVRIYRENLTSDRLLAIRDRYFKLVE